MLQQLLAADGTLVVFSLLLGGLIGMLAERVRTERTSRPLRRDD
ncbi:hypothetical protein [Sandarakinorhabdus sp.]